MHSSGAPVRISELLISGKTSVKQFLALLMLPLLLGACASTTGHLPILSSDAAAPYGLGAGDTLQIIVFGESDLTGAYRVNDSGMVAMPLVGAIAAAGLDLDQFRQRLTERLQANAVRNPNVTVTINEYRPFFILGEVKNPGSYAYVPNMTVLTAVAIAGGFTYRASESEIAVTRQNGGKPGEFQASRAARVLPGDVVYVFERHF